MSCQRWPRPAAVAFYVAALAAAKSYQLRTWLVSAQKRANLRATGGLHVLRHTFCSHLAMRWAPATAIQELAGYADLSTTLRYMHLSPSALETAAAKEAIQPISR